MLTANFNHSLFLPAEYHMNKLVETATKIAVQNFEWRYITFVVFNSTMLYGIENLLCLYEKSYIIGNGLFYPPFAEKTRQYIIFGSSVTNIGYILDWMQSHQFDNTGKHIVICDSQEKGHCKEADAVELLWDHKITDVIFLKNGDKEEVLGYSYFPFINGCNIVRPVHLSTLDFFQNKTYLNEIFPMKLKNLYRCPITVSIYQQVPYMTVINDVPTGIDGDLLRIIIKALNATLRVTNPRRGSGWGNLDQDGQWLGSLGDVYDDFANFSMTSAAITLSRFSSFQMSTDYYYAKVLWITHPAALQPSSFKLLYPVQTSTQAAVVISFIFVIAVAYFVRSGFWSKISQKLGMKPPRVSLVFYSWLVCMGLPLVKLPTQQRIVSIVILWVWYCFLLRTTYQVCLIPVLRSNYYFSGFETIRDAYDAKYPFGGGAALRDFYIDDPFVFDNWQIVEAKDIIPTLYKIANGTKFVIAMSGENAITLIRTKNLQVHILSEIVIKTPTVIFFKKFSPLKQPINAILKLLIESGFVDKAYKDYMKKLDPKEATTSGPLKADHYKGCYLILMAGWVTSATFFVLEISYFKYNTSCKLLI